MVIEREMPAGCFGRPPACAAHGHTGTRAHAHAGSRCPLQLGRWVSVYLVVATQSRQHGFSTLVFYNETCTAPIPLPSLPQFGHVSLALVVYSNASRLRINKQLQCLNKAKNGDNVVHRRAFLTKLRCKRTSMQSLNHLSWVINQRFKAAFLCYLCG